MPYVTADQSLPRSLDVQIALSRPQAETRTNLAIACLACENLGFLHNSSRVRFYSTLEAVEEDFIAGTEAHFGASAFFAQTPRATTLAIGEVFSADMPAQLVAPVMTAAELASLVAVSDGSMTITYDAGAGSTTETLTSLDFTSCTDLQDVADVINTALGSGADLEAVLWTPPGGSEQLVIQTVAAGDDLVIAEAVAHTSGTFVGTILGLTEAAGASVLDGYTPTGVADELSSIANAAAVVDQYLYGWALGASLRTVVDQTAAAEWALGRTAVMALCSNDPLALDSGSSADIGSIVAATGNRRVVCIYHDNVQRYPDVSILAYMLSVNYRGKDSTVTAKFKQLPGIETVQLTETQWTTLQSKGYNTYTAIGNDARTYRDGVTQSTGWFMDTVINLDNFVEDLSVNVFNVFLRNKKVPYTRMGQMLLADACRDTGYQYTYNGTFADRETLDSTKKGGITLIPAVQVILTPIANMSVADRASRIGPPIEMIVQEAGAIHSIAVNVEVVS